MEKRQVIVCNCGSIKRFGEWVNRPTAALIAEVYSGKYTIKHEKCIHCKKRKSAKRYKNRHNRLLKAR